METKTTIRNLFYTPTITFSIPAYQRAYSWEVDADRRQVEQFVSDLREQQEFTVFDPHTNRIQRKNYFLGHFLFERDAHDTEKYWVIDGQQRLTTVVIFIGALLHMLRARQAKGEVLQDLEGKPVAINRIVENYLEMDGHIKFETVPYDNPFFRTIVLEDQEGPTPDTASSKRIHKAKTCFLKQMAPMSTQELLTWKDVVDHAIITTFEVEDKVQATQIFAFQNDRGKDLTALEKIKAFLMQQVYTLSPSHHCEDKIKNLEALFSDIYKQCERVVGYTEDQILGFHCTAYLPGGTSSVDRVKAALRKAGKTAGLAWISDFAVNLKESFMAMEQIERLSDQNGPVSDCLILGGGRVIPLLLKLFRHTTGENKVPRIQSICGLVEPVLFRLEYTTADYRTDQFPKIALNYQGEYDQLAAYLKDISKRGFQFWWDFEGSCKAYFMGTDHYSPRIKYVLWKYENKLRDQNRIHPISPVDFLNKYGRKALENTIDHITPGNPSFTTYSEEFRLRWLNNIGNLVLMAWGDNSEKRNKNPVDEAAMYDGLFVSHKEVNKTLTTHQKWDEEEIRMRRDDLYRFVVQEWKLV